MVKFDTHNQFSVSYETISSILDRYDIQKFSYESMKKGMENTTLLITTDERKYALRIYRRLNKTDSMIETEIEFQEILQKNNLPVPHIYPNSNLEKLTVIEINGITWQTILMEYMGKSDFKQLTPELVKEMAQTQAKMHELGIEFAKGKSTHENVRTELKERLSQGHRVDVDDKKIVDFIERARAYYVSLNQELPYGYNHLDYDTHGNILVKDEKIHAILDFDDLAYSPASMCLAYALWGVLFISNDSKLVSLYLEEYQKVRPLTQEELTILPKIMSFRNYAIGAIEITIRKTTANIKNIMNLEKEIKNMQFQN